VCPTNSLPPNCIFSLDPRISVAASSAAGAAHFFENLFLDHGDSTLSVDEYRYSSATFMSLSW
jgi:hypothetical protein